MSPYFSRAQLLSPALSLECLGDKASILLHLTSTVSSPGAHLFPTSVLQISCLFFKDLFVYFYFWLQWVFSASLGLSLVASSEGCSLVAVRGLLVTVASLVSEHRF